MIPPFEDSGFLPSGIHPATLSEIAERFGDSSELRRVQMESILWMVDIAIRAGVTRIILNGSFTTDILEPNDVDCVLLFDPNGSGDATAKSELSKVLPFLEKILADPAEFDFFITVYFAHDRHRVKKGMIEVVL